MGSYFLTAAGLEQGVTVGRVTAGGPEAFVIAADSQVQAQRLAATGQPSGGRFVPSYGQVKPALASPTAAQLDAFFASSPLAASGNYLGFGVL